MLSKGIEKKGRKGNPLEAIKKNGTALAPFFFILA